MNPAWRRRATLIVLVVGAMVAMGGCAVIQANRDTALALDRAGFRNASLSASSINGNETIDANMEQPVGLATQGDGDKAAQVIWATFHYRIDDINLNISDNGSGFAQTYGRTDLVAKFGPRPSSYDAHTISSALARTGRTVLIVIGIGGLLFVIFVVVMIVVLVRFGRRRRAAAPLAPAWGVTAFAGGYGYQPPSGTWAPPAPAPGPGQWGPPASPAPPGQWGPPPGPPPYGSPPYGSPPYGSPPYGAPPYGAPPGSWGPPPGQPPPEPWGPPGPERPPGQWDALLAPTDDRPPPPS